MKEQKILIIILIGLALILKLSFLPIMANEYDIRSLEYWSKNISQQGLTRIYEAEVPSNLSEPNYPPGAMYPLALAGGNVYLIKIIYILFDLLTAGFIYYVFRKKISPVKAGWVMVFYLLNPMAWFNSGVWGAADSVHSFFVLLAIYYLSEKKYLIAAGSLGLAATMKPQALIFIPLVFIYIWLDKKMKTTLKSGLVFLGMIAFICLPWIVTGKIQEVANVFTGAVGYFTRLSSLAFNLWYLIYGFKSIAINDQDLVFNLLSYRQLSLIIFGLIYLGVIGWLIYLRKKISWEKERLLILVFSAGVAAQAFFLFCAEMHERYLFQIIPLIILLYYDKGWGKYYWYFTLAIFANCLLSLPLLYIWETVEIPTRLLSLINLGVFGFFIYQGLTHFGPVSSKVKHKS